MTARNLITLAVRWIRRIFGLRVESKQTDDAWDATLPGGYRLFADRADRTET